MTVQEQLRSQVSAVLGELVPEDKREEFSQKIEASLAPVMETIGKTFEKYEKDIFKLRERKAASGDTPPIDPRDYEELQKKAQTYEEQLDEMSGKEREWSRKLNAAEKRNQEALERLARESADLNATLMSNELRKAMGALSLAEGAGDEVFDILAKNVRVMQDEKGLRRIAAITRDAAGVELEKPLNEYVKGWAETSALAKRVLVAPRNSGTGGQGSQGSVGAPATLETQYAAALQRGDMATAIGLKARLAQEVQ